MMDPQRAADFIEGLIRQSGIVKNMTNLLKNATETITKEANILTQLSDHEAYMPSIDWDSTIEVIY